VKSLGRLCLILIAAAGCAAASEPVLRVATGSALATNLLRNGDFEQSQGTVLTGWQAAPDGYHIANGEGRAGSQALACVMPDESGWRGASQTVLLNRSAPAPLVVSGWSKAENVSGGRDSGYSIYVDLLYADGTPLWGQTANFSTGTHDWERREVLIHPEKPVRSLTVHCLLRGHAGQVWFDDVSVVEIAAEGEAFVFQGTPMERVLPLPPAAGDAREYATPDGLRLVLRGQRAVALEIDGRELGGGSPGGFFARDVAANTDLFSFTEGACPELGLELETTFQVQATHLVAEGTLRDTSESDRAVMLLFALPIDATGWTWGEDIRRQRIVRGRGEFVRANPVDCGSTGTMSVYPLAALYDERTGLALALDMGQPAQYRLVYHAATQQFFIAFDFGLVPDTERLPGAARFRFVLYRFDPAWGFRAAWQKLVEIFPEYFLVRSREQGIWMPFTDVSTVQGWEDFGFRYHEGDNNVPWDDAHGILSFRYTEPMTWWMPMAPELPRTTAVALRVRDEYAAGGPGRHRDMAIVSQSAAMLEANGQPALRFRNEPWANGAVWSLNPNPHLPASPNAATVHWNEALINRLYGPSAAGRLDGEYLDSLEGYVTAELNFQREHFRHSTVPLTFSTDTRQPALFKGLAIYEFTRWISEEVHRLGGLLFANGVPYRFGFLCPWLDVLGTETDWMSGGVYRPVSDAQASLWRTLAGAKPYLLLMNTDYDRFTPDLVERYFQRCLFYGFFPSMFSHNAAENPYWRNATWYNRDRPLFKRYLPLIKQVAEAGWQPVTLATSDNPHLFVERFGPNSGGMTYFTLLNDTAQPQTGALRWSPAADPGSPAVIATELISGERLSLEDGGWPIAAAPGATAVVRIEPGPRFLRAEATPAGQLGLTIETPAGLPQVLESSTDLNAWWAVETITPATSPFTLAVALADDEPERYFRLRW